MGRYNTYWGFDNITNSSSNDYYNEIYNGMNDTDDNETHNITEDWDWSNML